MNKKIITGLIALMGISIIGIITVQLVWMNNAIRVKNELFDRSVNEALTSTTNRLESFQDFQMINHFAFEDSLHQQMLLPPIPPHSGLLNFPHTPVIAPKPPKSPADRKIKMIVKASKTRNGFNYQISSKNDSSNLNPAENVIIIDADSLGKNLGSAYSRQILKIDSLARKMHNASPGIQHRFEIKANRLKNVADKVVNEITAWESREPSIEHIGKILRKELENRNIPIAFEFGVINDSTIAGKTPDADTILLGKTPYKVHLFPNDIIQRNNLLSVYFPEKDSYIYQTLNWLLIISLIFSIIVLVTFAVSIYFILRQKKISEMKSDFINNMTHEFKTPIATISVAADSITNQKIIENPDQIRYFTEMIKKENLRMNRQVEDILTIARLDKKDFEFKWEAVNLHEIIENAIQSIVLQVEKKGGTIRSELHAINPVATSDSSHFANLFYNLLDNANKYSLNAPEIKISTRNNNKGVLISVEDKGIGMTKSVQSRIFERFYRQTSGNIHNVKGFGLGLSYVKAVLEANHGSISVHSEPGKGSRFEVFIPFVRE